MASRLHSAGSIPALLPLGSQELGGSDMLSETFESRELGAKRGKFESIVFGCALMFVFLRFSALAEIFAALTNRDLYLYYIFGPILIVGVVATGGLRRTFQERTAKYWLCFLIWMALAVPFSVWRGGSFGLLTGYLKTTFIMLPAIAGFVKTWGDCRKIISCIALAALCNMGSAVLFQSGSGRLGFGQEAGTLGNPDDFAAHMLLVLPFVLFFVLKPNTRLLLRLVLGAAVAFGLFQVLRTASRGALLALMLTAVVFFFRGSARQKGIVLAMVVLIVVSATIFLPTATWRRLTSFSSGASAPKTEATESTQERQFLLQESIKRTLEHPILGLGPGQFPTYEGKMGIGGGSVRWLASHNSYTGISSECGIPALIFYLAALISTFLLFKNTARAATSAYKQEIAIAAYCIPVGLFAYSVAVFFVNFGYNYEPISISGLVIAMWTIAGCAAPAASLDGSPDPVSSRLFFA